MPGRPRGRVGVGTDERDQRASKDAFALLGRGPQLADNLRRVGRAAGEAGFDTLSVMDHVVQIPSVGPEWEDIPDLAAA